MPSTSIPILTIVRSTAERLRAGEWFYDAANLDLVAAALEPRPVVPCDARARRLFGTNWTRHETEVGE